jgi:hypothetical protein
MLVRANARTSSGVAADAAVDIEERELLEQASKEQRGNAEDGQKALLAHRQRYGNMLELATEALGNRELQFVGRHLHAVMLPLREHLSRINSCTGTQPYVNSTLACEAGSRRMASHFQTNLAEFD